MRVLVCSAGTATLDPREAGTVVAEAWAGLGHQVAVVPLATAGDRLAAAVSGLPGVALVRPAPGASSSHDVGFDIAASDAATVLVDLTGPCPDDAGEGLLAALSGGAAPGEAAESGRVALRGRSLVGVAEEDDVAAAFLGVRGVAARRTYGSERPDIGAALAGDAALARWASSLGIADPPPGAGAGNGLGLAILALGGTIRTGPQAIGAAVGIDVSLRAADLVVVVTEALDFGGAGIPETTAAAAWASEGLVPCVAIASSVRISGRELRTLGVESAYDVGVDLVAGAARVARSWDW